VSTDVRVAVGAAPLLARFNAADIVAAADVHVAQRLGRLAGETDEEVLLAVALTVRAVRGGSVCLELADAAETAVPESEDAAPADDLPWPEPDRWTRKVTASTRLVAVGADGRDDAPVRWVDGRLYLDRYWRDEQRVRAEVDARLRREMAGPDAERLRSAVQRMFPATDDSRQRLAAAAAALGHLTVLTGGPGTGKTTTVARLLAVLQETAGPGLRVALAAPTGKAAARLQEAVRESLDRLDPVDRRRVGEPQAMTVHRLLGWRPGTSTRFRHDRDHHLPHDVVVVDETSMVSLPLMSRLLEALRPTARLVLVGDPDQLASVEAGAVLGDLVARSPVADRLPGLLEQVLPDDLRPSVAATGTAATGTGTGTGTGTVDPVRGLRNGVVRLEVVHRHGARIGDLAAAIRNGQADDALALLRAGHPEAQLVEVAGDRPSEAEVAGLRSDARAAGRTLVRAARDGDAAAALRALESHRVLVAHRRGPAGVAHWSALVEEWVAEAARADATPPAGGLTGPVEQTWYPGRPLLVTRNDRDSGLYNGDTGVVVADGSGGVVAVFGDPDTPLRIRPHRLPAVETVHAMTVHRAQGSQFGQVSLVLPPATSPLLTRELLYTAVTRARSGVRVVGTADAVRAAVQRPVRRASGLRAGLPG